MIGPFTAYAANASLDEDETWKVRDCEGHVICSLLVEGCWDQAKLVAEALAAMLNAAPRQSAAETLKAIRDDKVRLLDDCVRALVDDEGLTGGALQLCQVYGGYRAQIGERFADADTLDAAAEALWEMLNPRQEAASGSA